MRWLWVTVVIGVLLLVVLVRMSVVTVDPTEFVYVTEFGRHVATYDGGRAEEAGLHFRWPWPVQSVQRLDRRLQYFDLPGTEVLTHVDAVDRGEGKTIDKTLTVEAYVCWRILDKAADERAVDRFVRRMGSADRVKAILGQRLNSRLGAIIGKRRMDDLISTGETNTGKKKVEVTLEALRDELMADLGDVARQEYGIDLVDVRLRRFNHPESVRSNIFDRIRSDRNRLAELHRSKGDKEARDIRSAAEEKARDVLARARAQEKILKGEAEAQADLIRNQAYSKDPEFYVFLKKLEKMQSILGENRTVLLLSTHRPMFDLLFAPPQPNGVPARVTGTGEGKTETPAPKGGAEARRPGGGQ